MKAFKTYIAEAHMKYKSQMSKKDKYKASKDYLMLKTQQSKLGKMPSRYKPRKGLEGPFMTKSGQVVYYDKKFGKYYNSDTDMYIDYDDWKKMSEGIEEMNFDRMLGIKGASRRSRPSTRNRGKEAKLSSSHKNQIHKIAKKHSGDMEAAIKEIEKMKIWAGQGIKDHSYVMDALRQHNEDLDLSKTGDAGTSKSVVKQEASAAQRRARKKAYLLKTMKKYGDAAKMGIPADQVNQRRNHPTRKKS